MRTGISLAVIASALVTVGGSTGRVNERVGYWTKITGSVRLELSSNAVSANQSSSRYSQLVRAAFAPC
jgi:hypothetical protein